MEVHHHPIAIGSHTESPPAGRAGKKWTHYLWEFLMLFLAVFCGFLAENQREHFVEAERAKVFAKNFLSDLKADTTEINTAIAAEKFRQASMDSIVSIALSLNGKLIVPGKFYYHSRFVSNLYTVDWNNSTINQLVQSGNLRLFKNKELVDKINWYYSWQNTIKEFDQFSHEKRLLATELRGKILQSRYYSLFAGVDYMVEQHRDKRSRPIDSLIKLQLPLKEDANLYMDEYINLLIEWKWSKERRLNTSLPNIVKGVEEIMQMLKKEYHLK